jgi:hypothetical protein
LTEEVERGSFDSTFPLLSSFIVKYLPLFLGVVCILGASYQLYRGAWLFINGQVSEGVVIKNEKSLGKSTVYYPIVQFQTIDGQTFECKGQSGTYPAEYEVNDTVNVHYNPADPTNALIGSLFSHVTGMLFSIALGLLFSFFGVKVLRWSKQNATDATTIARSQDGN